MSDQPPKKARQFNFVLWYAIIGFVFGLLGLILATVIALLDAQLPITLENAVMLHLTNPLLWFFDTAPIVIAVLLGLAGRGENRVVREHQKSALSSEKLFAEISILKNQISDLEKRNRGLEDSLKDQEDSSSSLQQSLDSLQLSSKSTEDIISRAKRQWETTFDSVQDMIVLAKTDGVIIRCNKATAEAFKMDYTEIIGLPVSNLIGSGENSSNWNWSSDQRMEIKIPMLESWYEVSVSPLELEDEQSGYIYIFRDITERRQAAYNMQLQKQYYESLVKNNPIAIATLKLDRTIVECNPAFEKLFGYSPTEVFGKVLDRVIALEGYQDEMNGFADAESQGEQLHFVTHCQRKDNTVIDVEYFQTPMMNHGRQVAILAFHHDISELRRNWEESAKAATLPSKVEAETIAPASLKTGKGGVNVEKIEGIGPSYAKRLSTVGITNTDDLLRLGSSRKGREELAEQTGLSGKLILAWVNRADLMRVPGVGEEYSDLLELAGVDTVKELRRRSPENLHQKMQEVNEQRKVVRRVPALSEVTAWIEAANEIEAILTY